MKGSPEVIKALQAAAGREAYLSMQYQLDARSLKFMGIKKLACKAKKLSKDQRDFLECVVDRILELDGDSSYATQKVLEQSSVTDLLKNELSLENGISTPYEQAVQTAMKAFDDVTRNIFEHLLKWHDEHEDWLERQLRLIDSLGESEYIAEKL